MEKINLLAILIICLAGAANAQTKEKPKRVVYITDSSDVGQLSSNFKKTILSDASTLDSLRLVTLAILKKRKDIKLQQVGFQKYFFFESISGKIWSRVQIVETKSRRKVYENYHEWNYKMLDILGDFRDEYLGDLYVNLTNSTSFSYPPTNDE